MVEGLWSVEFTRADGGAEDDDQGSGVVVLETQRVLGGDYGYTYIGNYEVAGGMMTVDVQITPFINEAASVFAGVEPGDPYDLQLSGHATDNEIQLAGHLKNDPSQQISINLIKRAELP